MVNETRLKVEFLVMLFMWLEERERSCRLIRGQSKPSRRLKNSACGADVAHRMSLSLSFSAGLSVSCKVKDCR